MQIFPAIDLKNKCAVRLTKGLMKSAKIYEKNPYLQAQKFENLGATWLHIVDLDGAFAAKPQNFEEIKKIRQNTNLKIQLGGGIRDEDTIKKYLDIGIDRLILGSIALKQKEKVKKWCLSYPLVIGIDALNGQVAIEGWAKTSEIKATILAQEYANAGAKAIICTDVSKDGMLEGVNLAWSKEMAISSNIPTIASGGVKDLQDIIDIKNTKEISGVIVGKAYYEGKIDLKEAFNLLKV